VVETSLPMCCCVDWIGGLARDHAGRLAAIARREGASAIDALDLVQDAFHTLLERPEAITLRDKPEEAAHLLTAIVRNAARNARRRHHRAKPHEDVEIAVEAAPPDPL
jgi:RNA polymerase sigma-70 factor, ECF subfamily